MNWSPAENDAYRNFLPPELRQARPLYYEEGELASVVYGQPRSSAEHAHHAQGIQMPDAVHSGYQEASSSYAGEQRDLATLHGMPGSSSEHQGVGPYNEQQEQPFHSLSGYHESTSSFGGHQLDPHAYERISNSLNEHQGMWHFNDFQESPVHVLSEPSASGSYFPGASFDPHSYHGMPENPNEILGAWHGMQQEIPSHVDSHYPGASSSFFGEHTARTINQGMTDSYGEYHGVSHRTEEQSNPIHSQQHTTYESYSIPSSSLQAPALTADEYLIFVAMLRRKPSTVKEIAEAAGVDSQAITQAFFEKLDNHLAALGQKVEVSRLGIDLENHYCIKKR